MIFSSNLPKKKPEIIIIIRKKKKKMKKEMFRMILYNLITMK